ncbi:MAG: aminotransferase class [Sediminibacterium sp.]|nr:aminotransferase class [Sediminibacterium sp.]
MLKKITPLKALTCFFNDRFLPLAETGLSITDLGIQRGYGIFDFLRVTNNVPLFIDDHLERFFRSAREMRLPLGQTTQELKEIIAQLILANNEPHSGIRILLTGGASPDGYSISQPNLVIIQQPMASPPGAISAGCTLATYPHQRQLPHVKTTDYLMAIWLQPWLKEQGADDILYHSNGFVTECPRSNFFIVTGDGKIVTPGRNILKGITRKQVLLLAETHQLPFEERDISIDEIRTAREAFIGSSTKRIIPVLRVDDIVFGPVRASSVTASLYALFLEKENGQLRGIH